MQPSHSQTRYQSRCVQVILFFALWTLAGCAKNETPVEGLWELIEVNDAEIIRAFRPTYVQFHSNSSFSVSRITGDLTGIYQLNGKKLYLKSTDERWFNTVWKSHRFQNKLSLKGIHDGFRPFTLTFQKIERFPSFDTFAERIDGTWELYKIKSQGEPLKTKDMKLTIREDFFILTHRNEIVEESAIDLDARHQKIIFTDSEISWNVWFFGKELRLDNKELGLLYSLRRVEEGS